MSISGEVGRLVIVGASLAGLRAAQAARKAGFEGELIVVGDERHMPYTRPPLSKELLAGSQTSQDTTLRLAKLEADWRLGVPAGRLDRAEHELILADGTHVAYDRVIIATGCRARRWRGPGAELAGVHTLRSLDDSLALKRDLQPGRRLVIVGAGFIGCEVAARSGWR
jgi:NADPH-dependent 2,4-dienoyl-CoA reductase/sulfur reductase-like enzyme